MELMSSARRFTYKIIFVTFYLAILLWFSIFFYGVVYFLYIPAVAHVHPIYLQYDTGCVETICKYPFANVTLVKPGYRQLLTGGQKYAIEVTLEMPESESNRQQGMFMVKLSMLSQTGTVLQTSQRPAVLHYRSHLFRIIYTIFFSPALLAGTFEEKQMLVVSLFENYVEDSYQPTHFASVELQARVAEVYSSNLQIHAQFTGLRYFMYYWPFVSTFIGIGSTFFILCIITVLTWMQYVMITPVDEAFGPVTNERLQRAQLSIRSKPKLDEIESMREPALRLPMGEGDGHQVSPIPPIQVGNRIEVIPTEQEHVHSEEISQSQETESELVLSLRRRKL